MTTDSLQDLANKLQRFAQDRDWQQFHSPKNLACALVVESAELLEHPFQVVDSARNPVFSVPVRPLCR